MQGFHQVSKQKKTFEATRPQAEWFNLFFEHSKKIQHVEDTNFDQGFETKCWHLVPTNTAPQFQQTLNLSFADIYV